MAIVTAAVAGVAGVGATIAGALIQKNAAENAANAQSQATLQALQMQIDERKRITDQATQAAQMSPNEINAINSLLTDKGAALQQTQNSIDKQQAQLDAMDPQVKAAGSELYSLLTGQSTKVLQPIQQQLQRQRNERMNELASQLGPGFMTTSAGIEAMNKFDTDAAATLNNVQQNYLSNITQSYLGLAGTENQGQAAVTAANNNLFAQQTAVDQTVLGAYQNVQGRIENAITGQTNQPVDFQAPAAVAGNAYAGANIFGQAIGGIGAGLGKISGQLAGQQATTTAAPSSMTVPSVASSFTYTPNLSSNVFSTGANPSSGS